ncbi:MAG: preprotein translocase subunit SecG [Proteobacteria bacterium]|nr:preprotein translocase subunit SecG [Pseudomonadota bacterium]
MDIFLTVLHVMVCVVLILVVLLQRGKGADMGAMLGGGSSQTVFGSRGAGNFLTKVTAGCAVIFMVTSLTLSYMGKMGSEELLFDDEEVVEETGAGILEEVIPGDAANEPASPSALEEIVPVPEETPPAE